MFKKQDAEGEIGELKRRKHFLKSAVQNCAALVDPKQSRKFQLAITSNRSIYLLKSASIQSRTSRSNCADTCLPPPQGHKYRSGHRSQLHNGSRSAQPARRFQAGPARRAAAAEASCWLPPAGSAAMQRRRPHALPKRRPLPIRSGIRSDLGNMNENNP